MPHRIYSPSIDKHVEKQMRNWEIARSQCVRADADQVREVEDFVAVSRAVASGGSQIAALLGEKLGWPVFDKQILQAMAGDDRVRKQLYESLDERDLGWMEELLRSLMHDEFPKNDYFHRLTKTVLAIARQGPAVFLGRGMDLILPTNRGFRVRIVAPKEMCVRNLTQRSDLSIDQAREEVERVEQERAEFLRRYLRTELDEPTRHDIIINMERYSPDQAVEVILAAMRIKAPVNPRLL